MVIKYKSHDSVEILRDDNKSINDLSIRLKPNGRIKLLSDDALKKEQPNENIVLLSFDWDKIEVFPENGYFGDFDFSLELLWKSGKIKRIKRHETKTFTLRFKEPHVAYSLIKEEPVVWTDNPVGRISIQGTDVEDKYRRKTHIIRVDTDSPIFILDGSQKLNQKTVDIHSNETLELYCDYPNEFTESLDWKYYFNGKEYTESLRFKKQSTPKILDVDLLLLDIKKEYILNENGDTIANVQIFNKANSLSLPLQISNVSITDGNEYCKIDAGEMSLAGGDKSQKIPVRLIGPSLKKVPQQSIKVTIKISTNAGEISKDLYLGGNNSIAPADASLVIIKAQDASIGIMDYRPKTFFIGEPIELDNIQLRNPNNRHIELEIDESCRQHVAFSKDKSFGYMVEPKSGMGNSIQQVPLCILNQNEPFVIKVIVYAQADYEELVKREFRIELKGKEPGVPEIVSFNLITNNNVYIGTQKEVRKFTISNTSNDTDTEKYLPLNLSKLTINSNKEKCDVCKIVGDIETPVLPGESRNLTIVANCQSDVSNIKPERDVRFSVRYDGQELKNFSLNIRKQDYVDPVFEWEKSEIERLFDGKEELLITTFSVVKGVVENQETQRPRKAECIYLEDNEYYFKTEDKRLSKIDILDEAKEYFICRSMKSVENPLKSERILIPMRYRSEDEEQYDMEEKYYILQQNTADPILDVEYLPEASAEFLPIQEENILPAFSYTPMQQANMVTIPLMKLRISNMQRIKTAKRDKKVLFTDIQSSDKLIIIEKTLPVEIYNGEKPVELDVLFDFSSFKHVGRDYHYSFKINLFGEQSLEYNFALDFKVVYNFSWYSLDLGTSGVVMAKKDENGQIDTISLDETDKAPESWIEKSKDILASILILGKKDDAVNSDGLLEFAPPLGRYNNARFVLPPIKFLVGQDYIPFTYRYKKVYQNIRDRENSAYLPLKDISEIHPDEIVRMIYLDIFNRLNESELNNIKKFIFTYPNTYTPEQIKKVKMVLGEVLPVKSKSNIRPVPESDAVAAYYLYEKRILKGDPLKEGEKILIYDMGAGTLDISYIVISNGKKGVTATIKDRIGIPIAGNFLDYVLFKSIENCIPENSDYFDIKRNIQNAKQFIGESGDGKARLDAVIKRFGVKDGCQIDFDKALESPFFEGYRKSCCDNVFKLILGEDWNKQKVKIVYSGRASQFKPLRDYIKKSVGDNWTSDYIDSDKRKTCVALGAIKYEEFFSPDIQTPFRIVSYNQYHKIGIVYPTYNEENVLKHEYKLLGSPNEINWDIIQELDGMKSASFVKDVDIDLRHGGKIYVIQTHLNNPDDISAIYDSRARRIIEEPREDKSCFVNEVFSFNGSDIITSGTTDRAAVIFKFVLETDNTINWAIANIPNKPRQLSERIEDNDNYINSTWPFFEEQ